jgi:hypothetical protein
MLFVFNFHRRELSLRWRLIWRAANWKGLHGVFNHFQVYVENLGVFTSNERHIDDTSTHSHYDDRILSKVFYSSS